MDLAVKKIVKQPKARSASDESARPILLLTIDNGSAHTRAAEAIAAAWRQINDRIPARIVEVSGFMSPLARFTHITAYLWLVKNAPSVWKKIDAHQKRQTQTSPEWFYRRECRKLFDLAREIQPCAIIATEVGCGEIGALIKRDLNLDVPLVVVSLDCDADRAWIQPEVDLYCLATDLIENDFLKYGAAADKIRIWGVPLAKEFKDLTDAERRKVREKVCGEFGFEANNPLVLISGGGEGLGAIEAVVKSLLDLPAQLIVLTGRNKKLKMRLEKIADRREIKILGWTENVAKLMHAADVSVSKLGLTFYEAMACALPIIALEPPPGAEWIQYQLLKKFGVGRAVKTAAEASNAVGELLANNNKLREMRVKTKVFGASEATENLAVWLADQIAADHKNTARKMEMAGEKLNYCEAAR